MLNNQVNFDFSIMKKLLDVAHGKLINIIDRHGILDQYLWMSVMPQEDHLYSKSAQKRQLLLGTVSHLFISDTNNGNVIPPRSPSRTTDDEYDYQMNNFSLIKAQLKASTYITSIDYFEQINISSASVQNDKLKTLSMMGLSVDELHSALERSQRHFMKFFYN